MRLAHFNPPDPLGLMAWLFPTLPSGPEGWLFAGLMVFFIARVAIYARRKTTTPTVPFDESQRAALESAKASLIKCAMAAGDTELAQNLQTMRLGGVLTDAYAEQIGANAATPVGSTTTNFAPSFFSNKLCEQYETLIHEASRVGGNYVEEEEVTPYSQLLAQEAAKFKAMAACLGCCKEFTKNNLPPGC